jgi:5-methylcytosine-specific restriction endonuclease McrA
MRRPRKHLPDAQSLLAADKQGGSKAPPPPIDPRAESLIRAPFPCANCDQPVADGRNFCDDLCRAEARYVRQYRARLADGTRWDLDIQDALKVKLAMILAGGYNVRLRRVPEQVRRAVIEREQDLWRTCGAPGEELDHISGDSNEMDNLQWLCSDCHWKKTIRNFKRISPETDPEAWAKAVMLDARGEAPTPQRLCDTSDWDSIWRTVQAARQQILSSADSH